MSELPRHVSSRPADCPPAVFLSAALLPQDTAGDRQEHATKEDTLLFFLPAPSTYAPAKTAPRRQRQASVSSGISRHSPRTGRLPMPVRQHPEVWRNVTGGRQDTMGKYLTIHRHQDSLQTHVPDSREPCSQRSGTTVPRPLAGGGSVPHRKAPCSLSNVFTGRKQCPLA